MGIFFNLPTNLLEALSTESMALVIGGIDVNKDVADTINNSTGCGCSVNNGSK